MSINSHENDLSQSSLQRRTRDLVDGKELTDEEIEKMKQDIPKELIPIYEKFGEIDSKFKTGSTTDFIAGMVNVYHLA